VSGIRYTRTLPVGLAGIGPREHDEMADWGGGAPTDPTPYEKQHVFRLRF
jgi:hypothetical protein